jgi:hypothetical protein
MKTFILQTATILSTAIAVASATEITYTNFIRQIQLPTGVQYDASVATSGEQLSPLEINPGGARFELWTIKSSPLTNYLLDTRYVGAYVPIAQVVIDCEDAYGKDLTNTGTVPSNIPAMIRRTRADRPFSVYITTSGLLSGATDPTPSKSVKLLRHVQSYGLAGTGVILDRTQATLLSQASIDSNGVQTLTYTLNSIPGSDRTKIRGEERFSVFSLADYQAPESQLASQFIQVWPVADGTISGITQNQSIRFSMPQVTLTLNDLYPDSRTYAQVYPGDPQLGKTGTIVPGSHQIINDSVPQSRVLSLMNYDDTFDSDGRWTMEILTVTPFGVDRLAYVSFTLDRTIQLNGSFNTIE